MNWVCLQCGERTFPGFYFCSDKHAKQAYSRLMHERAVILSDTTPRSCFICGIMEKICTNIDHFSFLDFKNKPVRGVVIFKETLLEMHHVSRIPEKVIPLCIKCHRGVELGHLRPDLKPEMSRKAFNRLKPILTLQKRDQKSRLKKEMRDRIWRNRLYGRL